jgi:hypothetical protein
MKKKRIKYDTAKNGQEAVDKYKDGKFHLILVKTFFECFCLYLSRTERVSSPDGHTDARERWY